MNLKLLLIKLSQAPTAAARADLEQSILFEVGLIEKRADFATRMLKTTASLLATGMGKADILSVITAALKRMEPPK